MAGAIALDALWHLDGTSGSAYFPEERGRSFSAVGPARLDTTQSKFGGASLLLDGVNACVYNNDPAAWLMGGGDFTLECFIRLRVAVTARQEIFSCFSTYGYGMQIADTGGLRCFAVNADMTTIVGPGAATVTEGVWHHVAFVREGSTLRIFLDGVSQGTGTFSGSVDPSGSTAMYVGRDATSSTRFFDGHIDEIRISKGLARYTADFAPPTMAFTPDPLLTVLNESATADAGGQPATSFTGLMTNFPGRLYRNFHILGAEARLIGTVKEKHTPDNTPLRRRVRLIRERDGATVGETWSEATTGAYAFTNIDSAEAYTVIAHDHEHNHRAVVADNLTVAGGGVELVA